MKKAVTSDYSQPANLIDFIEDLAEDHHWGYERLALDELAVICPGSWSSYRLVFMWAEDMQTLGISASFDMRISQVAMSSMYELLARINEQVWIGHFDFSDDNMPTYRYTLLVGNKHSDCQELAEELIQIAVSECERFYPAFQFAIWSGKKPTEALASAMLETLGEA